MIFKIFLSAVCLYLAFPNIFNVHGFWPLAWVFAVPLFDIIDGKKFNKKCWIGLLSGIFTYGFLVQWLWPVHKIGTIMFVLALSVQTIIFCSLFLSFSSSWLGFIYVPALWTASEWIRTVVLQGFSWGVGYSQSFYPPLIQLAAWTGSYGISFLIICVNYCLFKLFRSSSLKIFYLIVALAVFAGAYFAGVGMLRDQKTDAFFSVCAIQPNISPHKKLDLKSFDENIEDQMRLTQKAVALNSPQLIIWPETAFAADLLKDQLWYQRFVKIASENGSYFLLGAAPIRAGKTFNSAVLIDAQGKTAGVYDKRFLVPISEYVPSAKWFSVFKEIFSFHGFDFTPGRGGGVLQIWNRTVPLQFGVMICSEVCYPSWTRRLVRDGADFAVVILNDGWFTQPAAIMMHAQNTIMRAVESGFDIISVGNTGLTARVGRHGILHEAEGLSLQKESYGTFYVSTQAHPTPYARIGDFFAVSCLLFVIIIFAYQRRIIVKKP